MKNTEMTHIHLIFYLLAFLVVSAWGLIVVPDACKMTHKLPCSDCHLEE
jgi:hypothetical protein